MYKFFPYIALFVVISLLQVLFFNNLSVSIYLAPLVYVAFIVLLPLQMTHFALLMVGLALGVVMDFSTGAAGLNTIATLFIAFIRPYLLNIVVKREVISTGGVPSEMLLGEEAYAKYLILLVLSHGAIFFGLEALSIENINLYLLRLAVSSIFSTIFIWLICRAFLAILFKNRG